MPSTTKSSHTPSRKKARSNTKKTDNDELVDIMEEIANLPPTSLKTLSDKDCKKNKVKYKKKVTPDPNEKADTKYRLIPYNGSFHDTNGHEKENEAFSLEICTDSEQIIVSPGDTVTVAGPSDKQDYFAKILSFYKNHFNNEINASIKWFFTAKELPKRLLPFDTHAKELFLSSSKNAENIEVESILNKCDIKWFSPTLLKKPNPEGCEYFYCKSFDGKVVRDVLSDNFRTEDVKSVAELRNGLLSPKRLRHTPSKFRDFEGEDFPNGLPESLPSTPSTRSTKAKTPAKDKAKAPNKTHQRSSKKVQKKKLHEAPILSPDQQIENKILTSPISASAFGRVEASAVALNILSSDGNDDDFDDTMSTSSKSSNMSKVSEKSDTKPKKVPKTQKTSKKKHIPVSAKKSNIEESIIGRDRLVISIPKAKLKNHAVVKLINYESKTRSSPRRESLNVRYQEEVTESGSDSESDFDDAKENASSSSDESLKENEQSSSARKSVRRQSTASSVKSIKRVRISDNKTTVTPIRIKMPRDKLPFIPARPTPKRKAKGNIEKSRERLHVSAVPECLPCREHEFQEIFSFVEGKIRSGGGGCMYVSGVPGTGKTATVREVMNELRQASDEGSIPDFKYVDINGMRLTEPRQAYVQLLWQLTKQKATADHAANLLTKLFSQRRRTSTVVLADELDLLWTKKQDVLYHLFDWPTHRHAQLIVVAIANTMDLPERILMNRVASRLGLTRLTFRPYTFKQLQEIVTSRLDGLNTFEADAIQLASRKVAAVSGDARRCLDICRRATEIVERESAKTVGIEHVHAALQEMFATPMIQAIRSCSKQEQLFLHAVVAEFRRSGMEEATLGRIIEQHTAISQLEGAAPVTVSVIVQMSQRLSSNRLILLEGGQRDLFSRIRLNVSVDDVLFALKQ